VARDLTLSSKLPPAIFGGHRPGVNSGTPAELAPIAKSGAKSGDLGGEQRILISWEISKLLISKVLIVGFDPAIRRFESFHPSQLQSEPNSRQFLHKNSHLCISSVS